jgi:hypothetical protein
MPTNDQLETLEVNDVVIDLGDVDTAQETLISDLSSIDTITISGMDYSSMNTITLPGYSYNSGATVGGITTINNINNNTQWTTGTGSYTWNTPAPPSVNISTDGIDMAAGTDIKIDGQSLKEFMKKMEQRLAILVPDPKKLEKFEALKKAYEHYKTMESLCFDEPKEDEDEC